MQKIFKNLSTLGLFLFIITAGIFLELFSNTTSCSDLNCLDNIIIVPLIIIGAIISIPLSYYLGYRIQKKIFNKKINFILVGILIILSILLVETRNTYIGNFIGDLPFIKFGQKYDYDTIRMLDDELNDMIGYFYWKNGRLPENITEIINFYITFKNTTTDGVNEHTPSDDIIGRANILEKKKNIISERGIKYSKNGNTEYTLCANFKTSRHKNDFEIFKVYNALGMFRYHDKGYFCINKTLDLIRDCSLCESQADGDIITTAAYYCIKSELDQSDIGKIRYPNNILYEPRFKHCKKPIVEAFNYISCFRYALEARTNARPNREIVPKKEIYDKCDKNLAAPFKYIKQNNIYKLCTTFRSDNTVFSDEVKNELKKDYLGVTGYFNIEHKKGEYCFD